MICNNKKYKFIPLILLIFWLTLISSTAQARFDHRDADRIDTEERSNTETYNDMSSYRYPRSWDDQWSSAQFGYRNSAGSLNVSRFRYDEDIKIKPNPLDSFTASFLQRRQEDLIEQTIEREVRLGWAFLPGVRVSILGDGDTFKEFGDIGVALNIFESKDFNFEAYYWNVDNYYRSKKSDSNAHRHQDSQTWGLKISRATETQGLSYSLRMENDSPLEWHYPAQGYEYEYWRRFLELNFTYPISSLQSIYLDTFQEIKMEKKLSLTIDGASKRMLRRVSEIEFGLDNKVDSQVRYTTGVQHILRYVDYLNGDLVAESALWKESYAPSKIRRFEWGLVMARHGMVSDRVGLQHGVYVNDVLIREDAREWKVWEIKYQFFVDIELNKNARLGVNTTWDVDQVARDFPYSKKHPFRPWGGGDLQFLMQI